LNTFQGALSSGAFTVTAELPVIDQADVSACLRLASALAEHVNAIQLGDHLPDTARVSSTALAALLLREGIDVTPTLNCRDRNRIALQSEILGMRAIGVTSMLLVRGEANSVRSQSLARRVFDVTGPELIAMAREIDENRLLLGTGDQVPPPGTDWNASALLEQSAAGARFLHLHPCFELDLIRSHMARLVEEKITWHYSVILTLSPTEQGVDSCAQMIRDVSGIPGVSGINLVCRDDPGTVISCLRSAGPLPVA
jgi:5,10-methylenetetrahydrofolate reductase